MVVAPVIFVAASVWMALAQQADGFVRFIGVIGLLFFGVFGVINAVMLFAVPVILRVDEHGIDSPRGGFAIDWYSARGIYVVTHRAGRMDHVYFAVDGEAVRSRSVMRVLSGINSRMVPVPRSATANMVTWGISTAPSVDEALAFIHGYAPNLPIHDLR